MYLWSLTSKLKPHYSCWTIML